MTERVVKQRWSWLLVLGVLVLLGSLLSWQWRTLQPAIGTTLTIHTLDVGQGAATLVVTPERYQILIDGGAGPQVLRALAKELPWYDRSLDLVVATHQDEDHVGGLVNVLERYQVSHVLWNGQKKTGPAGDAFTSAVRKEPNANVYIASAGLQLKVGASTTIKVLAPAYRPQKIATNAGSVVVRIEFGATSLLLPGDIPQAVERYLVERYGVQLVSTALQLSHHGSAHSNDSLFLETVNPVVAVVAVGADNRYGHPAPEVVERVKGRGIPLFSTAKLGTVTLKSDGQQMWREP